MSRRKHFFERILVEMAEEGEFDDGDQRGPYRDWKNMMVLPDDPMIAVPFDETAWHILPIFFFDPTVYFARIGMEHERPCARKGWGHSRFVRTINRGQFTTPRLVKGRATDYAAAAVSMHCSECRRERLVLKRQLDAASSQLGGDSDEVVQLKQQFEKCTYGFNTLHPQYLAHLAGRYPFIHAAVKFHTSHRAAITHDVKMDCFRAMRVMRSSRDLESEYHELRSFEATLKHVAFASVQRCYLKHEDRKLLLQGAGPNRPSIPDQWVELTGVDSVSHISDTFVTQIQISECDKDEIYFNQWHEQNVTRGPIVHVDHHGKRDNAIQLSGQHLYLDPHERLATASRRSSLVARRTSELVCSCMPR
jgi:hypothetical protein